MPADYFLFTRLDSTRETGALVRPAMRRLDRRMLALNCSSASICRDHSAAIFLYRVFFSLPATMQHPAPA